MTSQEQRVLEAAWALNKIWQERWGQKERDELFMAVIELDKPCKE